MGKDKTGHKGSKTTEPDVWTYYECHKQFSDKNDKILQCSGSCENFFCIKCIPFTDDVEYKVLQRDDCLWLCTICIKSKNKEGQYEVLSHSLEKIDKMENKIAKQIEKLQVKINDMVMPGEEN